MNEKKVTYLEAISQAIREEMRRDEAVGRLQTSIDYDKGKRTPSYNDHDSSVDYLRVMVP